jgi:hypothetical protein
VGLGKIYSRVEPHPCKHPPGEFNHGIDAAGFSAHTRRMAEKSPIKNDLSAACHLLNWERIAK